MILATSTAGTTRSDYMDRTLGFGYAVGAALLGVLLAVVLVVWRITLGSIRADHIADRRAEAFYGLAILVSNTLGTALGDYLADSSGLGDGLSNLVIGGAICAIGLVYLFTDVSRTILFWAAFVLTRPFGATMGDLRTKAPEKGSLGLWTVGSTTALLCTLLLLIVVSHRSRADHRSSAG